MKIMRDTKKLYLFHSIHKNDIHTRKIEKKRVPKHTQIRFMKCLHFVASLFFFCSRFSSKFCRSSFHFVSSVMLTVRVGFFFVDSTDSHPGLSNREEKKWFSYFDCSNTLQQQHSCESLSCATPPSPAINRYSQAVLCEFSQSNDAVYK